MPLEGCRCPWCGMVTMVLVELGDFSVMGICNECGNRYEAKPHPKYHGRGVLMYKIDGAMVNND